MSKINYEYRKFVIDINKEGELYNLSTNENINLLKFDPKIIEKKFNIITKNLGITKEINDINFEELLRIQDEHNEELEISIINNNIKFIYTNNGTNINIITNEPKKIKEIIIKSIIEEFYYAKEYKNYEEFLTFLKNALENSFVIIENEEFPGAMLKFYNNNKFIKSVYIINEEIKFLDSFADEYKKLKIANIKETLEDLNDQLILENKEKLILEFK